ncbi:MAG: redoxin domain-containing protein, partial [Bacteroidales bacterium]|nr:redoxin domain-containing protein [Bacteroidales bacterium]
MRRILSLAILATILWPLRAQTTIDTAVNFSAKDVSGYTHKLFEILDSGKMVVIDFFSTSCGPCGTYAPQIQDSYENFGQNSGNVYFLGISWGDDNQGVHLFDSTYGITYPGVSGTQGSGNQINIAYNILSYPTVILILPNKLIKEKHIWPPTTAKIDSILLANGGITTGMSRRQTGITDIQIWPNPFTDRLNIGVNHQEASKVVLRITDLSGKTLY